MPYRLDTVTNFYLRLYEETNQKILLRGESIFLLMSKVCLSIIVNCFI